MDIKDSLYIFQGVCTNVVDGDTIDVILDLGFKTSAERRLRLINVDTPERGQDNFREATNFTKLCVEGQKIYIQTYKDDVFGRYLAKVYYNSDNEVRCLNDDLKTEGLLKPYSKWNKK
ncbi:endonuclease [Staphylococcus phage 6ec]|uniref:Nuclease n=1 Tax=Staphylococcus phage 6ec TaxID=1500386 RepID=A0A060AB13_9CAUD|nr:endonuclease [Staphylococcus phage 6ec]AIA64035.1 nuclease [Staphylococcus phage 6ec]